MDNLNAAMGDFYFENEDLVELYERMEDGDGTYEEIAEYFDNHIPDWRKNKGLGQWAPEFITDYWREFDTYNELIDEEEREAAEEEEDERREIELRKTLSEWLEDMKNHIIYDYNNKQSTYQYIRLKNFYNEYEEYLSDNGLRDTKKSLAAFEKEDDEKICLVF
jgi:hypothetical protein